MVRRPELQVGAEKRDVHDLNEQVVARVVPPVDSDLAKPGHRSLHRSAKERSRARAARGAIAARPTVPSPPARFTVVPVEGTEEGTDRWAIEHDFISMTPLRLDLTDTDTLLAVQERHRFT
jgi:hypothetical protein